VFGVFLIVAAMGGSVAFWTLTSDTRGVVVAARDLPAGAVLATGDLAIARVRVDDSIYQAAVPASELSDLVGRQIAEPIHASQVLARAQVAPRPALGPGQLVLAIPVAPESAVGGTLYPGDAVEVLVTTDQGKPDVKTTVVLPRAMVYDVGHSGTVGAINVDAAGVTSPQGPVRWLSMIVSRDEATRLVQAKWVGELDVALLPPG
jgi:Flp pilus assembly protein CpaB